MTRAMGVTEARNRLGEIVDRVRYLGDAVLLEKNGRPAAALVPIALFEQLIKEREPVAQTASEMNEDELLAMIDEAVHAVRAQTTPPPP